MPNWHCYESLRKVRFFFFFLFHDKTSSHSSSETIWTISVYLQDRRCLDKTSWPCFRNNCYKGQWKRKHPSIYLPTRYTAISPPLLPLFPFSAFYQLLFFSFLSTSCPPLHLSFTLSELTPLLPLFSFSFFLFIYSWMPPFSLSPPFFPICRPLPPFSTPLLFDPWLNFHIPGAFLQD